MHLLLTSFETKILFLKSHNFIIWSRIHSMLSFDNYTYNELLPSSKVKALNLGLQAVTELWLHTICLPEAITRSSGPQPIWLPCENETSRHIINPQNNSQELFKTNHRRGQPPLSSWLPACLSPAHPLINKHKNGSVSLCTPVLSCRGVNLFRKHGRGGNWILWRAQSGIVKFGKSQGNNHCPRSSFSKGPILFSSIHTS